MSECGRYAKKSNQKNYTCMRRGIGVGSHIKLSSDYRPDDENEFSNIYCGTKKTSKNASPYKCFKKGFKLGKNIQYGKRQYKMRENFSETFNKNISSIYIIIISIVIALAAFGLLTLMSMYWLWALIIGFAAGTLFLYYCNCE